MKKYIENNFIVIVFVISMLSFFKSCNDSRELSKIKNEITEIKENTYTKEELSKQLQIIGLETEKRFIQSTDRKMLDVQRQTQIDEELKALKK